jgi:hypothetical protein
MSRIEEQGKQKRFQVFVAGFIAGSVKALTLPEAEVEAQREYGPQATVGRAFDIDVEPEFLEDELGNRTFKMLASYRAAFIPIVKNTPRTVPGEGINAGKLLTVGMEEETYGPVGEVVDSWFLHHPGVHVIHFGSTKDPETGAVGFLVIYYTMIELPTIHTLDELSAKPYMTEPMLREQREFLVRLTTDLRSNEALFEFANSVGVEWNPAKHPLTERGNCVQAIRRFFLWI